MSLKHKCANPRLAVQMSKGTGTCVHLIKFAKGVKAQEHR